MQKEKRIIYRLSALLFSMIPLIAIGMWVHGRFWPVENLPVHSLLEISGAIIALFLAFFLFKFDNHDEYLSRFHFTALALIVMAILDLFHAMYSSGSLFVWLHIIAMFAGSIVFLGILLPERKVPLYIYNGLPILTAILSILIALVVIVNSEALPAALVNG